MSAAAVATERIVVVSATRRTPDEFGRGTALGRSMHRLRFERRLKGVVAFQNSFGLSAVYNAALAAAAPDDILVFVHDDVWLDDFRLCDRLIDGLQHYDVIGVAGNRRRQPRQPSWMFADLAQPASDVEFVSGAVAHGAEPFGDVGCYGPAPAACELLDGVLLAARARRLKEAGLTFDTRFDFHFYDLDFCRSARALGLSLGTWPIAITHQSKGSFADPRWRSGFEKYLDKWGD